MQLFLPFLALFVVVEAAVFVLPPPTSVYPDGNVPQSIIVGGPYIPPTPTISGCACNDQKCDNICLRRPKCGTGGQCIGNNCYCYKFGPQCPSLPAF